jgi:YrhK-like protein
VAAGPAGLVDGAPVRVGIDDVPGAGGRRLAGSGDPVPGGTILFNISTFAAMNTALSTRQVNVRVWAPDVIGSACFLVSSAPAFANAEHRWLSSCPHELDWQIAACKLFGSIAFGVSARASFVSPSTGLVTHGDLANLGTAVGALGFLVGTILLVPASLGESPRAQISSDRVDRA